MAVTEDGAQDDAAKAAEKQAKKERKAFVLFIPCDLIEAT